ncbi:MR-MLE family protein [Oribacterium sp. C9]|uniref:mandelate racemase/muconate lactonizing enzyme family protein n=1 Tax=Oribacterium sp. C9 TaxID=1943579 RepID=UPI00098F9C80|nr:mandelate racemase/muconate lactonizing enzyme family protein [Oribacterium sp. C9]OON87489.1 MR-MLE family protein [Oribacterium sp. C9]
MKITKVEVFRLPTANSKQNSPIGCRVHTDTGLYGDGEAGMAYGIGGDAAYSMVVDLAQLIIGMDPLQTELIWETMYKKTFWGQNGGPVIFSGIAAIDVAIWDIKGKYFEVPVYQLLGGKVRDKLRAYASQLQFGWGMVGESENLWAVKPEDYAHNVKLAVAEGYDAIKIDFFDRDEEGKPLSFLDTTGFLTPKQLKMVEARMSAAREAAGDEVDIIMENHSYPDALGAVQLGKLAEKYHIMAFEEPNTPSTQTVEYIAKYTSVPIANGERLFSRWQYADYFKKNLLQLAQPDIGNCGGISEVKKIADMAHAFDVGIQVHAAGSPLTTDIAIQLECTLPNFIIHEHHVCNRSDTSVGLTKYNRQPVNGYLEIPDLPGIGNEFLQSAIDNAVLYKVVE